ncbi:RNA polymerase sigma factor [Reyranella sp. CPCC 100927]|uniref:RNA polymerase sigma factor n=1 Tax=Reyranella sp. CPCC 100927 TaxID=2599616 RepID=UPI0011B77E0A|nr:RNA polymerase sigma factor [Reyranella sp. CPCC 100927]TWT03889.1 RNA polymerase sigma factor [Reyranella sp. CPCC 100927]
MADSSRAILRRLLLVGYDDFARWLTARLGCADQARDALQDTFLRLERSVEIGPLRSPRAYLRRIALNIATNRRIAERRHLTDQETEALLALPDETPDPARTIEARSEVEALKRALAEIPTRRRAIFLAAWVEEAPQQDIAARFGISVRTVQIELKHALEHCAARLERDHGKNFASAPRRLSSK